MGRPATVWKREDVAARILDGENLLICRGRVLRIPSSWLSAHPGGALAILHFIGRDATDEVEAYHYEDTLKTMERYTVGTVEVGEEGWEPLMPPVMVGWVRRVGSDGKLEWFNEATAVRSTENTEFSPSSQILLVEKSATDKDQAPTLSTISPPPTPLCPKLQARHSAAYKELHQRIVDAGLYKTPFISGYGPEFLRYILFATLSAIAYKHNWLTISAVFIGLFWHQLTFFAHDLGHTGVTHIWFWDRIIAIFIADFCGGLSIGWWVDNHNIHHLVTNHPSHDPDIQHLPFFACSPAFLNNLYSSYYKFVFPMDFLARLVIPFQHKLFYLIMSLARFNLYRLSYTFLWKQRNNKKRVRGGLMTWRLEIIGMCVFWWWFSRVLIGCGTWKKALWYLLVSNVVASPLHVQIVLSHYSRSTADVGLVESFAHRQLRTTTDVICPESIGWIHGGLHLQVTHHLFPRLPRHNLKKASVLVKDFASEQGLEYAEFGFVEGNNEVTGALKNVADQFKIIGMVAEGEIREAMEARKI
ncbi:delta 8-sphingoloid desaturase protein [Neolentinus lepideus HHB14362 ss-1]|uniref:Delta 8-(E)-sphingolipid desaturase n=1 Tax=Neolentinus lepideus HHB14362 ss-1 TaxID=1314782 RepID=A0A165W4G0_9AGAM|nr:delta 8-sphingoloid desaturase protein [Neolentinus lepideus HHB14362 ss-1]